MPPSPQLYIIAGCNGAGKTTACFTLLPEMLGCREYVNADEIARGLSPFNPAGATLEAGRLMLRRIHALLDRRQDFAIETTLAPRSYVKLVELAHMCGYFVTLLFFWLPTPELAIERVATRVRAGGHGIPADVIRRRYFNGLRNLTELYVPLCDCWLIYDNSTVEDEIRVVATGGRNVAIEICDTMSYSKITADEQG